MTDEKLEIIEDAAQIAEAVWTKIDFDKISNSRNINDEFASRIATASYTGDITDFVQRLASKMGVRSLKENKEVVEIVDKYKDNSSKFLKTVRNHSTLVVLKMKELRGDLN